MSSRNSSSSDGRVVSLRPGRPGTGPQAGAPPPVQDLARYERPPGDQEDKDDYGHRMIVNAAAFGVGLAFVGGGGLMLNSLFNRRLPCP
jgi:hypothetical protein